MKRFSLHAFGDNVEFRELPMYHVKAAGYLSIHDTLLLLILVLLSVCKFP